MQENQKSRQILTLEDRSALTITGVSEIESSDDTTVKINTNLGKLFIIGSNLSIDKINIETGEFSLNGQIKKLEYKTLSQNGKFSSLFK